MFLPKKERWTEQQDITHNYWPDHSEEPNEDKAAVPYERNSNRVKKQRF